MTRFVTRGRYTQEYAKRLLDVPEDREPAVRKLIEEAGGKLISYYMTTGDSDFLLISEANESEAIIAPLMAFSAAGMFSNVATVRAWTAAEFKSIAMLVIPQASSFYVMRSNEKIKGGTRTKVIRNGPLGREDCLLSR